MTNTSYATLAELRQVLGKPVTDTGDDLNLQIMLNAAAELIDRHTGRAAKFDGFLADAIASERIYPTAGGWAVYIDECVEITAVAAKDSPTDTVYTALTAGDWVGFRGSADRPNYNGLPYTGVMITATGNQEPFESGRYFGRRGFRREYYQSRMVPMVKVTAKWGFAVTIPQTIKLATIGQSERWWKRSQAAWADATSNETFGMLWVKKLDPDIAKMLEPFVLPYQLARRA